MIVTAWARAARLGRALVILGALGAATSGGALPVAAQGSSAPSAVGSPAPSAVGSPAPSAAAPVDGFRVPHDVPDLESLFPSSVDGRPLFRMSMGRPSLEAMGDASLGDLDALVSELGVARTDLEIAFANDPAASPAFNYLAFRVAGVDGPTLVETYERMVPQTEVGATAQRVAVDGREVVWVAMPSNPIPNIWFWAEGDTLVGIQAADQATFERLYRLLPAPVRSPFPSASAPA